MAWSSPSTLTSACELIHARHYQPEQRDRLQRLARREQGAVVERRAGARVEQVDRHRTAPALRARRRNRSAARASRPCPGSRRSKAHADFARKPGGRGRCRPRCASCRSRGTPLCTSRGCGCTGARLPPRAFCLLAHNSPSEHATSSPVSRAVRRRRPRAPSVTAAPPGPCTATTMVNWVALPRAERLPQQPRRGRGTRTRRHRSRTGPTASRRRSPRGTFPDLVLMRLGFDFGAAVGESNPVCEATTSGSCSRGSAPPPRPVAGEGTGAHRAGHEQRWRGACGSVGRAGRGERRGSTRRSAAPPVGRCPTSPRPGDGAAGARPGGRSPRSSRCRRPPNGRRPAR